MQQLAKTPRVPILPRHGAGSGRPSAASPTDRAPILAGLLVGRWWSTIPPKGYCATTRLSTPTIFDRHHASRSLSLAACPARRHHVPTICFVPRRYLSVAPEQLRPTACVPPHAAHLPPMCRPCVAHVSPTCHPRAAHALPTWAAHGGRVGRMFGARGRRVGGASAAHERPRFGTFGRKRTVPENCQGVASPRSLESIPGEIKCPSASRAWPNFD